MACTRMVFGAEPFPHAWRCFQRWHLSRDWMEGMIRVVSERDQRSRPPALQIRFGRNAPLDATDGDGGYRFGPMRLILDAPALPYRSVLPAPVMLTTLQQDAVELRLTAFENEDERDFCKGLSLQARISIVLTTQELS